MIVTPDDEIEPGQSIDVVAVRTLIVDPLPEDHVLLPWQRPRHPRTGLSRRCAAVASWVAVISPERIIRTVGIVPTRRLVDLALILDRQKPRD